MIPTRLVPLATLPGKNISLMGLAGSEMEKQAGIHDLPFIAEAFADRSYSKNGGLVSRKEKEAVIHEPEKAAEQVFNIVVNHEVYCLDGTKISIKADSICIHGDNPEAVSILRAIDRIFTNHNIGKTNKTG